MSSWLGTRKIKVLGGRCAVVGGGGLPSYLLRDGAAGVMISDAMYVPSGVSAIVAVEGVRQRLRRSLPGSWLVVRDPEGRHRGYGLDRGEWRMVRPGGALRRVLDEAEPRPLADQLGACGLGEVAADEGSMSICAHPQRPDLLCVHHVVERALSIVSMDVMAQWDPGMRVATDDGDGAVRDVVVPIGARGKSAVFHGAVDDITVAHLLNQPGESGRDGGHEWRFPSPHFHTRSGDIVGSAWAVRKADRSNDPRQDGHVPGHDHL